MSEQRTHILIVSKRSSRRLAKRKAEKQQAAEVTDTKALPAQERLATPTDPAAAKAVPLEYSQPRNLCFSGATGADGAPWVKLTVDGDEYCQPRGEGANIVRSAWTRLSDWEGSAGEAQRKLRQANIHLFGDAWKDAIYKAQSLQVFPIVPVIERPGWTGDHFALPSGEVFSPPGHQPAVVLFEVDTYRCSKKGHLAAWLEGVAKLATGQSIITYCLMIAFVAPLLELATILFNPGFELAGPKRKGKSTVQLLVATVFGPAAEQHGRNYILPANTTVNALEEEASKHRDRLLVIEEMSLFYGDERPESRARKMLELVMRLASGSAKARRGEPQGEPARYVYLSSTNEGTLGMFGLIPSATSSAAGDRLSTIPIAPTRKHGIFDTLPKGFTSSKEAIHAILELVRENYGLAMPVYLAALVQARAADKAGLKNRIQALNDEFKAAVGGIDDNDGSEATIVDVHGLVYAAGKLAQDWGALPPQLGVLRAAVEVYTQNRELRAPPLSNFERLRQLADSKTAIRIDAKHLTAISDEELSKAPALLLTRRFGSVEVLLTDEALVRAFKTRRFLNDPEIKAIHNTDKDGRAKRTVSIRTNRKQERLYAFVLGSRP